MLPENHRDIVEAIMISTSRFRGMADSELGRRNLPGFDKICQDTMPYLYASVEGIEFSPIIEACGRYLDHPTGQGFYNIIVAAKKEFPLEMYLQIYLDMMLPNPDIKWCLE